MHFETVLLNPHAAPSSQKNPAGSGYSKGPRKMPDPERPPQPGVNPILPLTICALRSPIDLTAPLTEK
jgi:hypothetical protein